MRHQHRLDLEGKDGVAAPEDALALAAVDPHEAPRRHRGEIAGAEPAVVDHRTGLLGSAEVFVHRGGGSDEHLATLAGGQPRAAVGHDLHADATNRTPARRWPGLRVARHLT